MFFWFVCEVEVWIVVVDFYFVYVGEDVVCCVG